MGWFRRRHESELQVQQALQSLQALEAEIATLAEQLEAERAERLELTVRLAGLSSRQDGDAKRLETRVAELGTALDRQLSELDGELAALHHELSTTVGAAEQRAVQRLGALEAAQAARLAEVEALAGQVSAGAVNATFEQLRDSQAKLANELVRFELAMREQVASAVEQLGTRRR